MSTQLYTEAELALNHFRAAHEWWEAKLADLEKATTPEEKAKAQQQVDKAKARLNKARSSYLS